MPLCALGEAEGCVPGRAVLVLNGPLPQHFAHIWASAPLRVCADGGANRVHAFALPLLPQQSTASYVPDAIVGDFDSVDSDVLRDFERQGARVVHDSSQDTDDISKACALVAASDVSQLLVLGAIGGNLTQELANFNAFFKCAITAN